VLRAIANAGSLDGVTITRPGGARTIVLSNYSSAPSWVVLDTTTRVRVLRVLARPPTVTRSTIEPAGGRARVELAPNSVDAIALGAAD
jgi:hypothetical protein